MPTDAPTEAGGGRTGSALAKGARGSGRALGSFARAVRWLGVATAGLLRRLARRTRTAIDAQGAAESGLARVIELHAVSAAGDALVAAALAGTLFFAVPVGEARSRVALYLLTTMAPFALMAPVIGPVLDRLRHGRRGALAATCAGRAAFALVISTALAGGGNALRLYPAAFGVLLLSKAYGVTRQAGVPRVLPHQIPLVKANARVALAGVVTSAVAAPLGVGLAWLTSPTWTLRLAAVVLFAGAVQALRLPRRVDSAAGEEPVDEMANGSPAAPSGPAGLRRGSDRRLRAMPHGLVTALRINAVLRAFSGFLTLFFAFLLRSHPLSGLSSTVGLGIVVAAATLGSFLGTVLGASLRDRAPELIVRLTLVAAAVSAAAATWIYGLLTVAATALIAGLAQTLGKLSSDAIVQRDVSESVRSSVFARSETLLQLAWVIGGGAGTALTTRGPVGMALGAAALTVTLAWVVRDGVVTRRRERSPHTSPNATSAAS